MSELRLAALARGFLVALVAGAVLVSTPGNADAFEPGMHWAVGAKGGMNLNLLSEPAEDVWDIPVPGFVGVSGGFGFAGEMLFGDFVGLEIDVIYAKTSGKGSVELNNIDFDQTLETTEVQIPVLLKGQVPFGVVKPYLAVGITFVNQLDAKYTMESPQPIDTEPKDGELELSYNMLTVALGAAIDFPFVRVPFEIRGMYQSLDDDPTKRAEWDTAGGLNQMAVYPNWEGQVWVLIGAQYSDGMIF